jgi:hypothetical protein
MPARQIKSGVGSVARGPARRQTAAARIAATKPDPQPEHDRATLRARERTRIAGAKERHPFNNTDPLSLLRLFQFVLVYNRAQTAGFPTDSILRATCPIFEPDARSCDLLAAELLLGGHRLLAVDRSFLFGRVIECDPRVGVSLKRLARVLLKLDSYGNREIRKKPAAHDLARWYRSQYPDASLREISRFLGLDHTTVARWDREGVFKMNPEELEDNPIALGLAEILVALASKMGFKIKF